MKILWAQFAPCILAALAAGAAEGDWPMWRCDAGRSGATAHALPQELKLQWKLALPAPDPAFDYHFRLCADAAYEPVAAGGLVFVPSNVNGSVAAYDLATGLERWRFVTEGPVRFAPVADGGRVWVASDDGHLYCLDAATGALRWKVRGAPEDRADHRMLVNGRMTSRWPARGGPLLAGGTIWFGCGVWPSEGVFVLAVDAETGAVRWRNAAIGQIDDGLEEHGLMADLGLPPHGYLALIAGKLVMPSGRALAAWLDPQTGKLDPYHSFYAKVYPAPRGAWAVCGNRDYCFQGGTLSATGPAVLEKLPAGPVTAEAFAKLCGKPVAWAEKLIADKAVAVTTEGGRRLVAFDARSQKHAMNLWGREPKPLQRQILEARPPVQMDVFGTRHEVGVWSLPVFTETTMFRSEVKAVKDVEVERGATRLRPPKYDALCAYGLREATWEFTPLRAWTVATAFQRSLRFKKLWQLDTPLAARIVAGDRLYAAGENQIAAIALPPPGGQPAIAWRAGVDGLPVGVIAANGRLIVTTDKGGLYCFGAQLSAPDSKSGGRFGVPALAGSGDLSDISTQPAKAGTPNQDAPPADKAWKERVAELARQSGATGGYALVWGWNSGALVRELARQTALSIVVVEPDAALAAKARTEPWSHGRVQVLCDAAGRLQLPPYFAELVMSEDFAPPQRQGPRWTKTALDAMRPFTGRALLRLRPKLLDMAGAHAKPPGGFTFEADGSLMRIRRTAAPSGADDWTHEAAGAANTFASADTRAVPPFGLLWYSGGIDRHFSPEFEYHHNRNPYPTVCDGRMFLLAARDAHAVDAYTGRHLWKTQMPPSAKAERRLGDHRTFSRPTDQNMIATPDRLYVIGEAEAQMLDPQTGKIIGELRVPDDDKAAWDEARVQGDTLFVAVGPRIVAMDRRSGAARWRHAGAQERVAFALGGNRVFAVDYTTARGSQAQRAGAFETQLTVLDAADGKRLWSAPLQAASRPAQHDRSVGKPSWRGVFMDNPFKPVVAFNSARGIALAIVDRHQFFAFDAASGKPLWQHTARTSLADLVAFEPPTVTRDLVVCDDGAILDVRTGQPAGLQQIGGRGTGCGRFVGSDALLTFRSALACVLDLKTQKRTYLSSTRSGCTNSMIPAAGLLNAPNFAHGCVCNYPFLTSFALIHMPEAAAWAGPTAPDVQTNRRPGMD